MPSYRAYSIKHRYDVSEFLEAYRLLLQRALDEIWAEIVWKHWTQSSNTEKQ
ncbi:MAG: hypothetical protein QXV05_00335 [Candidatus Korarchaeum sp.]